MTTRQHHRIAGSWLAAALAAAGLAFWGAGALAHEPEEEAMSFDHLERVESSRVAVAYIDPYADFSAFQRVAILDPFVAFRSNWQRDQNRSRSRNITTSDMDRIRADVGALFVEVFRERLQAAGYEVVDVAGEDVMILRPAIIDLDITAPDTMTAGRSRTYTATTGAATLYMELFDSLSGDIIGRAADRRTARQAGGFVTWSSRVTNTAEARRMFGRWADKLVEFLNKHYRAEAAAD